MPTTRQKRGRHQRVRVTPEAVEAWRKGDWLALHRALRLRPWECSPFDADGPAAGDAYRSSFEQARELRAELEAASAD